MASMIPIASQEKFDSISPVRSNGQAINLELQFRSGDDVDQLRSSRFKVGDSCANSIAPSSDGSGEAGGGSSGTTDDEDDLPSEAHKTLLCLAALVLVFAANLLSIASISYRIPATKQDANQTHPPLRDIAYDISLSAPQLQRHQLLLLVAAEVSVLATSAYVGAVVVFHRHRSIVFRRFCFVLALLFGLRLLTMNVTMLPVSSASLYHCAARERAVAVGPIGSHFLHLMAHLGLSVDGEIRYCGNYVFNGHAVILVLNCLWVDEYGVPRRRLLGLLMKVVAAASLVSLVAAGYDYTISIITAYYATTRIFWIYHTLANNVSLKRYDPVNQVCKEWWYPIFRYLEGNVRHIVPSPNKFQ